VLCATCRERKARFKYRGEVRVDRDHTLCFECYRAEINRTRARRFRERATPPVMRSPSSPQELAGSHALDVRRVAHRQRMLEYLQRASGAGIAVRGLAGTKVPALQDGEWVGTEVPAPHY
jgi:hypothetical protein